MQQTEEQANEKELDDAWQKRSEKEQEIIKMEEEVSLGLRELESGVWLQKTKVELHNAKLEQTRKDSEEKLSEREQEIEKMRQEEGAGDWKNETGS